LEQQSLPKKKGRKRNFLPFSRKLARVSCRLDPRLQELSQFQHKIPQLLAC